MQMYAHQCRNVLDTPKNTSLYFLKGGMVPHMTDIGSLSTSGLSSHLLEIRVYQDRCTIWIMTDLTSKPRMCCRR